MDTYCKVFRSILTSTLWQEPHPTRIVWITLLAMKDQYGVVEASIPGLAHTAVVSVKECEEALKRLSSKDIHSRTKDNDGRRIEIIDGGFKILNHDKYRDKTADHRKEYQRRKQAEYREKAKRLKRLGPVMTLQEKLAIKRDEEGSPI